MKISHIVPCIIVVILTIFINSWLGVTVKGDNIIIYHYVLGMFLALVFGILFDWFNRQGGKTRNFDDLVKIGDNNNKPNTKK